MRQKTHQTMMIHPKNEHDGPSTATDLISVVDTGTDKKDKNDPDPRDVKNALDSDHIYIPPLQQRIEMLKKLTGDNPKDREI